MENLKNIDKILILDFGSQFTQLIARRIRENKVYSEIHPFNVSMDFIKKIWSERNYSFGRTFERLRKRRAENK